MGCRALFDYGVDIGVHFAGDVAVCAGAGIMVYFGGRIVVFNWGYFLSLAPYEVFACDLAFVRNRRQCLFLFCRPVWRSISVSEVQAHFCARFDNYAVVKRCTVIQNCS